MALFLCNSLLFDIEEITISSIFQGLKQNILLAWKSHSFFFSCPLKASSPAFPLYVCTEKYSVEIAIIYTLQLFLKPLLHSIYSIQFQAFSRSIDSQLYEDNLMK